MGFKENVHVKAWHSYGHTLEWIAYSNENSKQVTQYFADCSNEITLALG